MPGIGGTDTTFGPVAQPDTDKPIQPKSWEEIQLEAWTLGMAPEEYLHQLRDENEKKALAVPGATQIQQLPQEIKEKTLWDLILDGADAQIQRGREYDTQMLLSGELNISVYWPESLVKIFAGSEWDSLNEQEQKAICIDPFGARGVAEARQLALSWGEEYYGPSFNKDDTQANAFKHAYWSAAGVFKIGDSRAKAIIDAHEWGETGESTDMDIFNNAAGSEIGTLYQSKSLEYMYANHISAGNQEFLDRGNYRDQFKYHGVEIPLTGNHFANIARMVKTAADLANGGILRWLK